MQLCGKCGAVISTVEGVAPADHHCANCHEASPQPVPPETINDQILEPAIPAVVSQPIPDVSTVQTQPFIEATPMPASAASMSTEVPTAIVRDPLAGVAPAIEKLPPSGVEELNFSTALSRPQASVQEPHSADHFKLPARAVPEGMRSGVLIAVVIVPLISYAILATIAIVILYSREAPFDPLERLPDLEGDFKGAQHERQSGLSYERVSPESQLSPKFQVRLGQRLRIGDVEVRPENVELCQIVFRQPGFEPERSEEKALALHLTLRNVSRDTVFSPTDPFFDRRWQAGGLAGKPYSFLEIGKERFFGGALEWHPGRPHESIDGQIYKVLHPGESLETLVCTNPVVDIERQLLAFRGSLLWRVQVRRGLVKVNEREVPATAVVGVLFTLADIKRGA